VLVATFEEVNRVDQSTPSSTLALPSLTFAWQFPEERETPPAAAAAVAAAAAANVDNNDRDPSTTYLDAPDVVQLAPFCLLAVRKKLAVVPEHCRLHQALLQSDHATQIKSNHGRGMEPRWVPQKPIGPR